MQITIRDQKLKAALEDEKEGRRRLGAEIAKKATLRMAALSAAETLGDFWPPYTRPERCHELKGELAGTFSIDLKHPFRLLFRPIDLQVPPNVDEKARWEAIKHIEILQIRDTHG